ncbi:hypothetical protein Tco_0380848, partial [Tanacetum coccineum]
TMPNTRSGATMTREAVDNLIARRVAEALKARDRGVKMVMIMKMEMVTEMEE